MPRAGLIPSFYRSLSSRLSQRIVAWIFLSLVVIELIILLPSYRVRRRSLLRELEDASTAVLLAVKTNTMTAMAPNELLNDFEAIALSELNVVGAVLYAPDGAIVDEFGERPTIDPQTIDLRKEVLRYGISSPNRYDVIWLPEQTQSIYTLIVRYDTTAVQTALRWYVINILGLVVVIAGFVTLVAFIGLERILITPVLHLRDDLMLAGDAVKQNGVPDFKSIQLARRDELGEVTTAFRTMFRRIQSEIRYRQQAEANVKREQAKSEQLLQNMLPAAIAQQLKQRQDDPHSTAIAHHIIANRVDEATILFADIADFTGLAAQVSPIRLVDVLNRIFSQFDQLAERHQLEKIKTIGDAYMVVGGVTTPLQNPAQAVVEMALDMQSVIQQFRRQDGTPFQLRIGINTGPVVAGVIGIKKYSYDLWGDAVNIASRMESHGAVGRIHITAATYERIKHRYAVEPRGEIAVKGRGRLKTYFLSGRLPPRHRPSLPSNAIANDLSSERSSS